MGNEAPAPGGVTPENANGGVTAELKNEIQRIVMGIFREHVPKAIQQSLQAALPASLERIAEDALKEDPAPSPAGGTPAAEPQAKTQKAQLEELRLQIANLNKGIESERQARAKAEQQAVETRKRAEVQSAFAKHLGADSPHLRPYVNEYLSQFEYKDGGIVRKVTGDYGDEQFVPADQAVEALFKSELKHLVPAKTAQLPQPGRPFGQPLLPQGQPQMGQQRVNPLIAEIATSLVETRPEAAQTLMNDAGKMYPTPANGTKR